MNRPDAQPVADPSQNVCAGSEPDLVTRRTRASVCTCRRPDARERQNGLRCEHDAAPQSQELDGPTVRRIGQQEYRFDGWVPHTRRSGATVMLSRWIANCADCGAAFVALTTLKGGKFLPNRRCEAHRAPGRRVG